MVIVKFTLMFLLIMFCTFICLISPMHLVLPTAVGLIALPVSVGLTLTLVFLFS
ncbi:hypothetical protein OLMES_4028 [Oleiphilus messinensis]|uniref:Uncharacterized protein n=1 Tax=Oleiphilus messinensis TaxID=141451 RepID=A0A1Y0IE33_9GAMM|nr:hypothetical protein OLMES_4028 [Oleiphilus messinensis]